MKQCTKCREWKSIDELCVDKAEKDGIRTYCKECKNKKERERYANNSEKEKAKNRRWYAINLEKAREMSRRFSAIHPEKAREREKRWRQQNPEKDIVKSEKRRALRKGNGGSISFDEWMFIKKKYENRCLCCGRSDVRLTMDHIIPLKMGGTHTAENIQPLCRSCNARKSAKHIDYRDGLAASTDTGTESE